MATRAIVGLGNPGSKYEDTRHNVGFMIVDRLAEHLPPPVGAPRGDVQFRNVRRLEADILKTEKVYLLKPTTFMNASGEAVAAAARFYRIDSSEMLVIYDDMDLALGKLRLRERGSAGGHNGMKSIVQHLGTDVFPRLKIGIGRREQRDQGEVIGHVLGPFTQKERSLANRSLDAAIQAVGLVLSEGMAEAMTKFNGLNLAEDCDS
jgi:PTH1 family peptidyl-tRNA hydrolase